MTLVYCSVNVNCKFSCQNSIETFVCFFKRSLAYSGAENTTSAIFPVSPLNLKQDCL